MNETIKTTLYAVTGGVMCSLAAKKIGVNREIGMAIGSAIGTILATNVHRINGVNKRITKVRLCSY